MPETLQLIFIYSFYSLRWFKFLITFFTNQVKLEKIFFDAVKQKCKTTDIEEIYEIKKDCDRTFLARLHENIWCVFFDNCIDLHTYI